jgi:peptidoglycan/xylan/chitin deacetylase (PgdA/CDA1 family)
VAEGWRRGAEVLLARLGVPAVLAGARRPSAVVLAYHNIVPTGEPPVGDVSLHVDQRAFARQLDFVSERLEIVPLPRLLDPGASERSRAAITFDDAYLGTMTAGLEELRTRGLPATVFVPPGLLGSEGFWWDLLAPGGGRPLAPDLRRHALDALEGRQSRILDWASGQGLVRASLPPHACPADPATLLERARQDGISLGAHTWSHPNLAQTSLAVARDELERSRTWLQARSDRYIDWLAYPYGLRTDQVVAEAAGRFEGAVLVDGGLAQTRGQWLAPRHETPRLNVSRGLTLEGLALRLAGIRR